jgi:hypothetical protein
LAGDIVTIDPPTEIVDERGQFATYWRRSGEGFRPDPSGQLRRADALLLAQHGPALAAELTVDGDLDLLEDLDLDLLLNRPEHAVGLGASHRGAVEAPDEGEL